MWTNKRPLIFRVQSSPTADIYRELSRRREKSGANERVLTFFFFFFLRKIMVVTFSLFNDVGFIRSLGPTLAQRPFGNGRDDR